MMERDRKKDKRKNGKDRRKKIEEIWRKKRC